MGEEHKEEQEAEIVLKVDMHCEACARKVAKALKGFQGVEEVSADCRASKVVVKVKGNKGADPIKVCERLQKKSGKKVELISPLPEEKKEEENKVTPPPPPPPEQEDKKDDEPPAVVTIVLKVRMHCEACAQVIQKRIRKIQGVESVETDLANDQVIVKGVIDPAKLVEYVHKRTGKQAWIVKEEDQGKKEEEKKQEEKKEEKEGGKETKGGKEEGEENKTEIKRSEYWASKNYVDYAYAPHIFSDENPNACSVM